MLTQEDPGLVLLAAPKAPLEAAIAPPAHKGCLKEVMTKHVHGETEKRLVESGLVHAVDAADGRTVSVTNWTAILARAQERSQGPSKGRNLELLLPCTQCRTQAA